MSTYARPPPFIYIMKGVNYMLAEVLGVFTEVSQWISTTIPTVMTMFYSTEGGLTYLGVLATASLAIGVAFLLIGVITNFIQFRG